MAEVEPSHYYGIARGYEGHPGLEPLTDVWRVHCIQCSEEAQNWVSRCEKAFPRDAPEVLYDPPEES